MIEVELEHLWTKERKTLSVEGIHKHIIYLYFPLSGTYELDTKKNIMRARSQRARTKCPYVLWIAADIELVRRQLWEHHNPHFKEHEEAYKRHQEKLIEIGMRK